MDNLLEALQSGAAFRDRRKRIPRNPGRSHSSSHGIIECKCSEPNTKKKTFLMKKNVFETVDLSS